MCQVGSFRAVPTLSHCLRAPLEDMKSPIFPVCQRGLSHSRACAQSPQERGVDSGHGSATPGDGDTGRALGPQGPVGEPPGRSPTPPILGHQAAPRLHPSFWPPLSWGRGPGFPSDPQSPPCGVRWSFDQNTMIFIPLSLQNRAEPFLQQRITPTP